MNLLTRWPRAFTALCIALLAPGCSRNLARTEGIAASAPENPGRQFQNLYTYASPLDQVFQVTYYRLNNPDLAYMTDAGLLQHWQSSGRAEGRLASPIFASGEYLALYPDLLATYGPSGHSQAVQHYLDIGIGEGRVGKRLLHPLLFVADQFKVMYPDLASLPVSQLREYWLTQGLPGGRIGSFAFSPSLYLVKYADLMQAYGATGYAQAASHYLTYYGTQYQRNAVPADPSGGGFLHAAAGSNFTLVRQAEIAGNMDLAERQTCDAADPIIPWGDLRSIIAVYHWNKPFFNQRLADMYNVGGQRKLSLLLWHRDDNYAFGDHWCMVIQGRNDAGVKGFLKQQFKDNITDIIHQAKALGFNEIVFRFGPMVQSHPFEWTSMAQGTPGRVQYDYDWSIIRDVRQTVLAAATSGAGATPRVLFDLSAEHAGTWLATWLNLPSPSTQLAYERALWQDYWNEFHTVADTIGFSIVPAPGFVLAQFTDVYDYVGHRPAAHGFDVYGEWNKLTTGDKTSIENTFLAMQSELLQVGAANSEIYLQETYTNSWDNRFTLYRAAQNSGLRIRSIFQWPRLYATLAHYNVEGLANTVDYHAYKPDQRSCTSPYPSQYTGAHNVVGLSNGDPRFLCFNNRWHDCGWEYSDPSWNTKALNGEFVGGFSCNLPTQSWQPLPYGF